MTMKLAIDLPGTPPYSSLVFIGNNQAEEFSAALASRLGDRIPYWIWDEKVFALWGERLKALSFPPIEMGRVIRFPASEQNKRLSTVEQLAVQLLELGADRGSTLIAVGGGVTGDVVGFLASIYLRGIPHIQVPTTLLAQVDSSIGGKTGVDLEQGKNLLGAFHQPQLIWMDLQFLETLPPEEFRQGMAEVIKTAMIGDEELWDYLETHTEVLMNRESKALCRMVTACCRLKSRVVQLDEKETGHRRILNLGHTVGHALERLSNYEIRHGDAVAMGLVAAMKLSVALGKVDARELGRLEELCNAWDLPIRMPTTFPPEAVIEAMQTDKKHIRGKLHFILPERIGEVAEYQELSARQIEEILGSLRGP
jgi:3-dehydroquinate synthase